MGYMKALATELYAKLQAFCVFLEQERHRGRKIHDDMEELILEGKATEEQADDWMYYEGYADGMAAAINKLRETFPLEK